MNTEFSIFRVIKGKEERAIEWMDLLTVRKAECEATLEREAMHYESLFKTWFNERLYLAWFSVQGESPSSILTSDHDIDKIHLAFWKECIDTNWNAIDMEHVVSFIPNNIQKAFTPKQ